MIPSTSDDREVGDHPRPGPLAWRVVVEDAPRSGPENMALDHALADTLAPGAGVLRFYRWARATVSFGRNQPASGNYDRELARELGMGFVRRPTGGRAVLHDLEHGCGGHRWRLEECVL